MNTQPYFFNTLPSLRIQSSDGKQTVDTAQILFLEACGNYTFLHLVTGSRLIASKNVGLFEAPLAQFGFIRLNKSIIVNLSFVKDTCYKDQEFAIKLINDQWYNCSRRKTPKVKKLIKQSKTL
ncbi:hypothetical protein GVN20_07050 [Runella sp. CRIBMP]|uniref:LytTR family DNA-binding domain-containing protein n=1 Tax=Runella sp. CRIBMP TaxID=2683261 RepID=UPI0014121661|nr:LytTR family DNA-binding domain-containing protein [Runella sp. CRIBMP]NBB19106.1 hypothetical protein [Runella sp. CRIBMP]